VLLLQGVELDIADHLVKVLNIGTVFADHLRIDHLPRL
jgi:hypothetical protein